MLRLENKKCWNIKKKTVQFFYLRKAKFHRIILFIFIYMLQYCWNNIYLNINALVTRYIVYSVAHSTTLKKNKIDYKCLLLYIITLNILITKFLIFFAKDYGLNIVSIYSRVIKKYQSIWSTFYKGDLSTTLLYDIDLETIKVITVK